MALKWGPIASLSAYQRFQPHGSSLSNALKHSLPFSSFWYISTSCSRMLHAPTNYTIPNTEFHLNFSSPAASCHLRHAHVFNVAQWWISLSQCINMIKTCHSVPYAAQACNVPEKKRNPMPYFVFVSKVNTCEVQGKKNLCSIEGSPVASGTPSCIQKG